MYTRTMTAAENIHSGHSFTINNNKNTKEWALWDLPTQKQVSHTTKQVSVETSVRDS